MKRSWIPIVVFVALLCWSFVDEDPHHQYSWTGKDYRVETTLLHGMYDGSYTSWYTNGQKRAAGEFKNNMRTGTWTVWDSTGKMRVQRAYKNSFEYTQIFPALPDGPAKLFGNPQCEWKYNAKGFIEYPYVWERAVMISKRVWREIPKEDWSPLFNDDRFWWIVRDAVMSGKVNLYADDEFRVKYVPPMLQPLNSDSAVTDSIVGYKIKEDWYYNSDLMLGEAVIIGICPVATNRGSGDHFNKDLGWIYFPQLRDELAKEKISAPGLPDYIHTFDDLFFFRYFHGNIYKESNVYDRELKEYAGGLYLKQEQDRIEYSLIELEHDQWLRFAQ